MTKDKRLLLVRILFINGLKQSLAWMALIGFPNLDPISTEIVPRIRLCQPATIETDYKL